MKLLLYVVYLWHCICTTPIIVGVELIQYRHVWIQLFSWVRSRSPRCSWLDLVLVVANSLFHAWMMSEEHEGEKGTHFNRFPLGPLAMIDGRLVLLPRKCYSFWETCFWSHTLPSMALMSECICPRKTNPIPRQDSWEQLVNVLLVWHWIIGSALRQAEMREVVPFLDEKGDASCRQILCSCWPCLSFHIMPPVIDSSRTWIPYH